MSTSKEQVRCLQGEPGARERERARARARARSGGGEGRIDRRTLLKGLGALAGTLTLAQGGLGLAQAQPLRGGAESDTSGSAGACPIEIRIENPLIKLRRPERKLTLYFDLVVQMPQGKLVEVKRTVRIIRAIKRKVRREEEIVFVPVTIRKKDMSGEIKEGKLVALGEENVLIDFGNLCYTMRHLGGLAFAAEILIQARGMTPGSEICSASQLVVQNFDVRKVCKF